MIKNGFYCLNTFSVSLEQTSNLEKMSVQPISVWIAITSASNAMDFFGLLFIRNPSVHKLLWPIDSH